MLNKKMDHGGDLLSYREHYDGELVDYSSNINPLGLPDGLKDKILENFRDLESYPDIEYRDLKKSIAEYLGCEIENVLVGNGAVDIIDLFALRSKRVVLMEPCFSEYSLRPKVYGKEVIGLSYSGDFSIDIKSIKESIRKGDTLILGNPNNPTGLRIDRASLIELYELALSLDFYLLLDEAFYEFAPLDYDSIELLKHKNFENLGVIRAATKFFAMPGLRLGYGCASRDIVKELEGLALPWRVNSFAELAGRYIFENKEYIEKTKAYLDCERNRLFRGLKKIPGLEVYPTHTNYILIKLLNIDENEAFIELLKRGFVVRKCSSFKGLGRNHIRIAIKDRDNNERLLRAFGDIEF